MTETSITKERFQQLRGTDVLDREGSKIGVVEELFIDQHTGSPEWLGIGTGFLRMKRALVPVAGANTDGDDIVRVPYEAQLVKDSPDIDDDRISEETERDLYSHYGVAGSKAGRDDASTGRSGKAKGSKESVTRSEEELRVGKERTETGRARLHKWVETEDVETDVTLQRERAKVERRPVDRTTSGAEIGEEDIEVTLEEERPVVAKETVAKEEVALTKEATEDTKRVGDTIRKEKVDIEGDDVEHSKR